MTNTIGHVLHLVERRPNGFTPSIARPNCRWRASFLNSCCKVKVKHTQGLYDHPTHTLGMTHTHKRGHHLVYTTHLAETGQTHVAKREGRDYPRIHIHTK